MADKGVQTTTATPANPAYIRQKIYDPVTHTYFPCETNTCRTRDKILSDIGQALGPHKEKTIELFRMLGIDQQEIDAFFKISIEDYESERKRFKHFVDDGRQFR
jgi:hypothetical protein